jgi:FkbH-like protein
MVAVPELPEDPAYFAQCLSDAGYFEAVRLTSEDAIRTRQYQENAQRDALKDAVPDLDSFLKGLGMEMQWAKLGSGSLSRVVQLINKTNQFNLTTRRYSETQVTALIDDPNAIAIQLRLTDRFGDNGIIAVVIGRVLEKSDLVLDCWLMSCRVLGRRIEQATLNLLADLASRRGVVRIKGEYLPTSKNGLVRDHYSKLGFSRVETTDDGRTTWVLSLDHFQPTDTAIAVIESRA